MISVTKKDLYCSRWLGNKRTNVDVFIFNGKGHGSLYRWFIIRHTHMHTQWVFWCQQRARWGQIRTKALFNAVRDGLGRRRIWMNIVNVVFHPTCAHLQCSFIFIYLTSDICGGVRKPSETRDARCYMFCAPH